MIRWALPVVCGQNRCFEVAYLLLRCFFKKGFFDNSSARFDLGLRVWSAGSTVALELSGNSKVLVLNFISTSDSLSDLESGNSYVNTNVICPQSWKIGGFKSKWWKCGNGIVTIWFSE